MKKWLIGGVFLLSVGLLTACGSKKENTDVTEELKALRKSVITTSQVGDAQTTASEAKEANAKTSKSSSSEEKDKERYKLVFADYKKMFDYANTGGTPTDPNYGDFLRQIRTKINSWVIEGVLRDPKKQRYAFYDVDNNGTSEMFIGLPATDGSVYATGFYYWNGSEPVLLAETFAGSAGGARSGFTVYKDGTVIATAWSSGTGDGTAILYQLSKENGVAATLDTRDVKMGVDDVNAVFGKSEEMIIDLNQLKWKEFGDVTGSTPAPAKQSGMDTQAILSGDLSSIEGTWRSSAGYSFTIKGNTFTDEHKSYTIARIKEDSGKVNWTLTEVMSSPPIYVMFPAGTPLSGVRTYTSDESKDRIFLQPQYDAPQEDIVVYYKED